MRRTFAVAVLLTSLGFTAQADEGGDLRSKSMAAASAAPAKMADAPFRAGRDPMPEMLMREEQERRGPRGACDQNATALCYDITDRRIVYRPVRQYMPKFDGLRPESVSLRHNRIVVKYSFK